MNRRQALLALGSCLVAPTSLLSKPPGSPPCKDCDKCDPRCRCDCKDGCRCRPGCCKPSREQSSRSRGQHPSRGRGYHPSRGRGRNPFPRHRGNFQPPSSRGWSRDRGRHPHHRTGSHGHPRSGGVCPNCKKPHTKRG